MYKSLVALAIIGATSVPASAQTAQAARATANPTGPTAINEAQPAKPQMIKKRVCEQIDEDSYSRLGNRKICKTIDVPVTSATPSGSESSTSAGQSH
jgi:hypothetical protein